MAKAGIKTIEVPWTVGSICTLLGLFALMFDYRSVDEGGNVYIYVTSLVSLVCFALAIFSKLTEVLSSRILMCWLCFLPVSLIVALANGVDFVGYGRSALSVYVFAFSLCAGYSAALSGLRFNLLFMAIAIIGVFNGAWKWHYSTSVASVDVYEMRYQILSAAVIFFLAVFISKFLFSRKIPLFLAVCAVPIFGAIVVSITRSLIFVALLLFLFSLFWYYIVERRRETGVGVVILVRQIVIVLVVIVFVIVPLVVYLRPNTFEAWSFRLAEIFDSGGSVDETAGVRGAQMLGMARSLGLNPVNWMVGKGFGNTYGIDIEFISRLSSLDLTARQMDAMLYRGLTADTTWMSLVFVGGAGLLSLFVAIFYNLFRYVRLLRNVPGVLGGNARDLMFIALALLGMSLTSNLLLDRLGSSILGIISGLAIGEMARLRLAPKGVHK